MKSNINLLRVSSFTSSIERYGFKSSSSTKSSMPSLFLHASTLCIDNNHVSQIAIPLLKNKDIQKQINDFALEANQKRYEAYKLEQQALAVMDNEVIFAK